MKNANLRSAVWMVSGLLALPLTAHAADSSFEKTLQVNGNVELTVSTGSGHIRVSPGSDNQVHVVGHVHANRGWLGGNSDDEVQRVAKNPPIEQSGNTVRIGSKGSGEGFWYKHVSIDYEVTTPKATQLKADSGSGDVQANGLAGGTKLETGSGSVEAQNLGGNVSLETGSGEIHASFMGSGNVTAHTGSGSIKLNDVRGGLKAETGSGDITASGRPEAGWKLETGSGSVELALGNAPFTLDAETGSGSIHSDQPIAMQGSLGSHHVSGSVNGGGPTVKVETGSGSIRIR